MNTEVIEAELKNIEEVIVKIRAIMTDINACSSDITKSILTAAVKKYAAVISAFKID